MKKEKYHCEQHSENKSRRKIVLTQKVFVRLCGLMNLSAYETMIRNEITETGEYLFGKVLPGGDVLFCEQSTSPRNITKEKSTRTFGAFCIDEESFYEAYEAVDGVRYNCIANVHTHPNAFTEMGRCFSPQDISYYRTEGDYFLNKDIAYFGCMMSEPTTGDHSADEISFISVVGEHIVYYPDVYIYTDGKVTPLKKMTDAIAVTKEGKTYNYYTAKNAKMADICETRRFTRTLMET